MGIGRLRDLAGEWQLAVDLPGAQDVRGHVVFETVGELLVQQTTVPVPEAPDSCCVVVAGADGSYLQHYFDSSTISALNSGVNERRLRGFFPMLSMIGHPSGDKPLMMDVPQSGSRPR
jgi:hypothetical protein